MAAPKFRVTMPVAAIGKHSYYGIDFTNGVAENVPDGHWMGDFHDWGFTIEPMVPPKPKAEPKADAPKLDELIEAEEAKDAELVGGSEPATKKRGRKRS